MAKPTHQCQMQCRLLFGFLEEVLPSQSAGHSIDVPQVLLDEVKLSFANHIHL